MSYREFTCIVCGAKAIDMSRTKTRKYCSDECAQIQYRRNHGYGSEDVTPPCIYNMAIRCAVHKCGTCGWNPKVEQRRKEALGYG